MDIAPYNAALRILTRRDHSKKELQKKLQAKFTLPELELNMLLEALIDNGYLDDTRFAESYTRSRMRKGFGPARIKLELKEKGVDAEIITQTITNVSENWSELAQTVRKKRFNHPPQDFKEKMRQSHFLRYRGFGAEQLESAFELTD